MRRRAHLLLRAQRKGLPRAREGVLDAVRIRLVTEKLQAFYLCIRRDNGSSERPTYKGVHLFYEDSHVTVFIIFIFFGKYM